MLVVVEPPHALAARRLEPKHPLHLSHRLDVLGKDPHDEGALVLLSEDARTEEAHEEGDERELVPCAVVEPRRRPKRGEQVEAQVWADGGSERIREVGREREELLLQSWLGLREGELVSQTVRNWHGSRCQ